MFSTPDPEVAQRMRAARSRAAALLGHTPDLDGDEVWGHGGRTLGGLVRTTAGRAWLRVLAVPESKIGSKLWTGTEQAEKVLPAAVPRPGLLETIDWTGDGQAYRAELTTYVAAPLCSPTPDLTAPLHLDGGWWADLRAALTAVAATPAPQDRENVISQAYVHRSLPRFLGASGVDTEVPTWTLAHGDLHWANLTSPELVILDWEGFGPAPHGFDAAHLHAYSLPVPRVAARVRRLFADVLDSPEGWLAELTVAAILLQAADRDPAHARLAAAVRAHADRLLTAGPPDTRHSAPPPHS